MRILTLLTCFFLATFFVSAQCVPDTNITHNVPGIYPDTITNLPHAYVGVAYGTTIQFKVKPDTVYLGLTVPIDSINVTNVTGLPTGFSYTCTPSNCSFPGGSNACVYLQGPAPTGAMQGTYPIVVSVKAYGVVLGTPTSLSANITGYNIVIDSTTGVSLIDRANFSVGQNNPNPAHGYTSIPVNLTHSSDVTLTVSNVIGKKVIERNYSLQFGKNTINLDIHGLQPGIYLYTITEGRNTTTRRMIVSNE